MIRVAQLLLLVAAAAAVGGRRGCRGCRCSPSTGSASRKTLTLDGAAWSNALLPMAVLLPAAALAALAVRGWVLRAMSVLVAMVSLVLGYLGDRA